MMRVAFLIFALGFVVAAQAETYPTEYPFSNEAATPPTFPSGNPAIYNDPTLFKIPGFDIETDDGGYMYNAYNCEITSDEKTFGFAQCHTMVFYSRYKHCGGPCNTEYTNMTNFLYCAYNKDVTGYTGLQSTAKGDCGHEGGCCSTGGTWKENWSGWWKVSDVLARDTKWLERSQSAMCPGKMNEPAFCIGGPMFAFSCVPRFTGPTGRSLAVPCFDSLYVWAAGCPVYKQEGQPIAAVWEPPKYLEKLSPDQKNSLFGFGYQQDKVCQPYSYYHPETAKAPTSSSAASSAASSGASSAASSAAPASSTTTTSGTSQFASFAIALMIACAFYV